MAHGEAAEQRTARVVRQAERPLGVRRVERRRLVEARLHLHFIELQPRERARRRQARRDQEVHPRIGTEQGGFTEIEVGEHDRRDVLLVANDLPLPVVGERRRRRERVADDRQRAHETLVFRPVRGHVHEQSLRQHALVAELEGGVLLRRHRREGPENVAVGVAACEPFGVAEDRDHCRPVGDVEVRLQGGRRLERAVVREAKRLIEGRAEDQPGLRAELRIVVLVIVEARGEHEAELVAERCRGLRIHAVLADLDVLPSEPVGEPLAIAAHHVTPVLAAPHQLGLEDLRDAEAVLQLGRVHLAIARPVGQQLHFLVGQAGIVRVVAVLRVPVDRVGVARARPGAICIEEPASEVELGLLELVLPAVELVAADVRLPNAIRHRCAAGDLQPVGVTHVVHQRSLAANDTVAPVDIAVYALFRARAGGSVVNELVLPVVHFLPLAGDLDADVAEHLRVARLHIAVAAAAAADLHARSREGAWILRPQRHHAVRGVGTIQRGTGAHEHLDTLEVDLRDGGELTHRQPVLRQHRDAAILHHQHAVVERRVEAAGVDGDARGAHLDEVEPRHLLERPRPVRPDGLLDRLDADARHRGGRIGDALRTA